MSAAMYDSCVCLGIRVCVCVVFPSHPRAASALQQPRCGGWRHRTGGRRSWKQLKFFTIQKSKHSYPSKFAEPEFSCKSSKFKSKSFSLRKLLYLSVLRLQGSTNSPYNSSFACPFFLSSSHYKHPVPQIFHLHLQQILFMIVL